MQKLQVEVNFQKAPRAWAKELNEGKKAGLFAALKRWHAQYLRHHFEEFSGSKYGYRRRSKKYEEYKRKKMGHTKPLVWSGETKAKMLGQMPQPVVTLREGRLVYRKLPKYMYVILPNHPMKNLEATTVTQGEGDALAGEVIAGMEKQFSSSGPGERVSA